MSIYKDNVTGKWRVVYRYTDWTGETHQSSKKRISYKTRSVDVGTGAFTEERSKTGYDF
mgnify:CR=1 FL=1